MIEATEVTLMQPYLFPYLGYFQLISMSDMFVIHDDVQFIKGGWINRNRILLGDRDKLFTLPIQKASSDLEINKRNFAPSFKEHKDKFKRLLEMAYYKAPYCSSVKELISEVLESEVRDIAVFISRSMRIICDYLSIETKFILSSEIEKDETLKGQDRVIEINQLLGSTHYINPIGGMELFSKEAFRKAGIELSFLRMRPVVYKQYNNEFVPNLSIIDVMMFNSREEIKELLGEYDLL
jgi:hypothetical protein